MGALVVLDIIALPGPPLSRLLHAPQPQAQGSSLHMVASDHDFGEDWAPTASFPDTWQNTWASLFCQGNCHSRSLGSSSFMCHNSREERQASVGKETASEIH